MEALQKTELIKSIKALPMFAKNSLNLPRDILPVNFYSKNEKQAIINCLVSQYDHQLPYNYIKEQYKKNNILAITAEPNNNLVMNVRKEFGENVAKYIFGYSKKNINKDKYYFFSQISDSVKNNNVADNIFLDETNFSDESIILSELQSIAKNNEFLLLIPLIIKHWTHITECTNRSDEIKKAILMDLKRIDNVNVYEKMITDLQISNYFVIPELDFNDKKKCVATLLTYFLMKNYSIPMDIPINDNMIGKLLMSLLGNRFPETLNITLPPKINADVKIIPLKNSESAPTVSLPHTILVPPKISLPVQNKNLIFQQLGEKTVVIPNTLELKQSTDKYSPENGFMSIVKNLITKIKGGCESSKVYKYCEETDVKNTDTSSFPDEELRYRGIILPSLSKQDTVPLTNINSLKHKLFSYAKINTLSENKEINGKLERLYQIFKNNTNHFFLEYNYNDYISETFVICGENEAEILEAYRLYFEITSIIIKKMIFDYKTIFEVPKEFLELIACNILVAINNFAYYNFKDLIIFRDYMEEFYSLGSKMNSKNTPILSLHNSIQDLIEKFIVKTDILKGGSTELIYDFDEKFDFPKHAYFLDACSYGLGVSASCSLTGDFETVSDYELFWNGIKNTRYEEFTVTQKFILQRYCLTFFVNDDDTDSGSKIIFENRLKSKDRVCFMAKLTGDNISTLDFMKTVSSKLTDENLEEIDIVDFSDKVENVFGSNVIIMQDKLRKLKDPKEIVPYIKVLSKENNKTNTVLESVLFFFSLLEKLGYEVTKNISKTNIVAKISPSLSIDRIKQIVTKNGGETEMQFIEKMERIINDITNINDNKTYENVDKSCNKNIPVGGGKTLSKINLLLPNNTNVENTDQVSSEIYELEENLEKLIRTNELTIDNVFRLIPYYIKDQIKISKYFDFDSLDEKIGGASQIINETESVSCSDKNNDDVDEIVIIKSENNKENDVFNIFLEKAKRAAENVKKNNSVESKEEMEKRVDKYVQERYINSLDYLVPYFDNKIQVGTNNDKEYFLMKQTLNCIEYLRKNYNTDLDQTIKNGVYGIYLLKEANSIFIYNLYIITQYIKHVTEELYASTKVMPARKVIDFTSLNGFRSLIKEKIEKNKTDKISLSNIDFINKKLDSKFQKTKLFKKHVETAFNDVFDEDGENLYKM